MESVRESFNVTFSLVKTSVHRRNCHNNDKTAMSFQSLALHLSKNNEISFLITGEMLSLVVVSVDFNLMRGFTQFPIAISALI